MHVILYYFKQRSTICQKTQSAVDKYVEKVQYTFIHSYIQISDWEQQEIFSRINHRKITVKDKRTSTAINISKEKRKCNENIRKCINGSKKYEHDLDIYHFEMKTKKDIRY